MTDSLDAYCLKSLVVKFGQMRPFNSVLGEGFGVLAEAELLQPVGDTIHHYSARFCPGSSLPRNAWSLGRFTSHVGHSGVGVAEGYESVPSVAVDPAQPPP